MLRGRWPLAVSNCHLLFHMMTVMFREFWCIPMRGLPAAIVPPMKKRAMRTTTLWACDSSRRSSQQQQKDRATGVALPSHDALAIVLATTPPCRWTIQATYWRFDGRVAKRPTSVGGTPSDGMGDLGVDRRRFDQAPIAIRRACSMIPVAFDNEVGNQEVAIDNRSFYTGGKSRTSGAKAGVQVNHIFDQASPSGFNRRRRRKVFAPYGIPCRCRGWGEQDLCGDRAPRSHYDVLLSQTLIAQPFVEPCWPRRTPAAIQLGSGLARYEVGLSCATRSAGVAPYLGGAPAGSTARPPTSGGGGGPARTCGARSASKSVFGSFNVVRRPSLHRGRGAALPVAARRSAAEERAVLQVAGG